MTNHTLTQSLVPRAAPRPTQSSIWEVWAVRLSTGSRMKTRWAVATSDDCTRTATGQAISTPTSVVIPGSTTFLDPTPPRGAGRCRGSAGSATIIPAHAVESRRLWHSE